jgi:hypothetical protein
MRPEHARGGFNAEQTFMAGIFLHSDGMPEKLLSGFRVAVGMHHLAAAMLIGIL